MNMQDTMSKGKANRIQYKEPLCYSAIERYFIKLSNASFKLLVSEEVFDPVSRYHTYCSDGFLLSAYNNFTHRNNSQ